MWVVFLLLPLAPPLLGLLLAAGALPATEPLGPQVQHRLPLKAGPLTAAAALTPPEPPVLRLVPLVVAPLPVTAPLALQAPLPLPLTAGPLPAAAALPPVEPPVLQRVPLVVATTPAHHHDAGASAAMPAAVAIHGH